LSESVIAAQGECLGFMIYCVVSRTERDKSDYGWKSSQNFAVFDPV